LEDALVGVTQECDYPPSVKGKPQLTASRISHETMTSAEIDHAVRSQLDGHGSIYDLDEERMLALRPRLILTQELCEVCAVSGGQVHRLATTLRPTPRVLSLTARDLGGIWNDIQSVGAALKLEDEAEELVLGLQSQLRKLRISRGVRRPRVLCVEWLDPVYLAGHWVPELIAAAGGVDVGAAPGSHSTQSTWSDLIRLEPDLIIIGLCGFGVDRARAELERLQDSQALELLCRVPTWIIDGNAYTSRPGPRVVEGASRIQSAMLHQEVPGLQHWQPATVC
jgi:iron complex transport system substrate-binding protein